MNITSSNICQHLWLGVHVLPFWTLPWAWCWLKCAQTRDCAPNFKHRLADFTCTTLHLTSFFLGGGVGFFRKRCPGFREERPWTRPELWGYRSQMAAAPQTQKVCQPGGELVSSSSSAWASKNISLNMRYKILILKTWFFFRFFFEASLQGAGCNYSRGPGAHTRSAEKWVSEMRTASHCSV